MRKLPKAQPKGSATKKTPAGFKTNPVVHKTAKTRRIHANPLPRTATALRRVAWEKSLDGRSTRQHQLLAILDNSPNLIFVKDVCGRYLFVNRRFEDVFHVCRAHIVGKTDRDLFSPRQAAAFQMNDRKVLDAGVPLEFEESAQHDDGVHTSIVFKFPLYEADGQPYAIGGITTDITDRKRIEQALRESQAKLEAALEARQQLDADLHDNIIQMVYAAGMSLEQTRHLLKHDTAAADEVIKGVLSHLNHIIADVRSYIRRQDPPRLGGNQLIATLSGLIRTMQDTHGLRFTLQLDPRVAQRLTSEQSLHLYGIAHEAISNCIRHANAQDAKLTLQVCGTSIRLEIEDNGIGFDKDKAAVMGHGLQNMRMRVQKLGGQLHIETHRPAGTRIVTIIPQRHSTC